MGTVESEPVEPLEALKTEASEPLEALRTEMEEANNLVKEVGELSIKFSIPQQTRWIGTLSMVFAPVLIVLLGYMAGTV